MIIALLMVPLNMTAVGPVTARVVDADKDPVVRACVVEVWQDYSAFEVSVAGKPQLDSLRLAFSVPAGSTFSSSPFSACAFPSIPHPQRPH